MKDVLVLQIECKSDTDFEMGLVDLGLFCMCNYAHLLNTFYIIIQKINLTFTTKLFLNVRKNQRPIKILYKGINWFSRHGGVLIVVKLFKPTRAC